MQEWYLSLPPLCAGCFCFQLTILFLCEMTFTWQNGEDNCVSLASDRQPRSICWMNPTQKKNGLNFSWNGNMSCQVWGEMIYTPYRTLFFIIFMSSADKVGENPEFIYLLCLQTDGVHHISIWHHQSISFDALAFDGCKLSTGSKKRNLGLRDQVR